MHSKTCAAQWACPRAENNMILSIIRIMIMWQPCTVWPSSTIHNQYNSQWRAGRHADPIQHLQRHQKTPSSHWTYCQATYIRTSSQDFWQGWVSLRDRTPQLWTHSPTSDHARHFSNLSDIRSRWPWLKETCQDSHGNESIRYSCHDYCDHSGVFLLTLWI